MDVLGDTPQYTQPRVQTHESGFMGINRFLTKYTTICSLVLKSGEIFVILMIPLISFTLRFVTSRET